MRAAQIGTPAAASSDDESLDEFIHRRKDKPVTFSALGAVVNTIFDLLVEMKDNRNRQVSALEARTKRLEQQPPSPHYAGTYEQDKAYGRGALVTRSGGLWLALEDTTETPSRSERWKLVVKSGESPR